MDTALDLFAQRVAGQHSLHRFQRLNQPWQDEGAGGGEWLVHQAAIQNQSVVVTKLYCVAGKQAPLALRVFICANQLQLAHQALVIQIQAIEIAGQIADHRFHMLLVGAANRAQCQRNAFVIGFAHQFQLNAEQAEETGQQCQCRFDMLAGRRCQGEGGEWCWHKHPMHAQGEVGIFRDFQGFAPAVGTKCLIDELRLAYWKRYPGSQLAGAAQ